MSSVLSNPFYSRLEQGFSLLECLCSLFLLSTFLVFIVPIYQEVEFLSQSQVKEKEARLILERELVRLESTQTNTRYDVTGVLHFATKYHIQSQITPYPEGKEVKIEVIWKDSKGNPHKITRSKRVVHPSQSQALPI
ncbi:prepilin-type N-terminal cleavage/methylation domain-containing protein [Risungbinella massiliensis]|uniref:prepilin-type N-terminal cleavage/methylation domain-containing protein n=1 Tax=Risungbinella massiliensis TaxID=1329796 RepID=UPI0005CBA446|nr:prepilin-type N-terminal cleavage/methylation domain-containing protein [Risungbinella massiliensis]